MSSAPQGCYLLLGSDRTRKRARLSQLARALQVHLLDQHRLHAAELPSGEFGAILRQHPVASPVRLLVIDEAQRLPGAQAALLNEQLPAVAQVACVVLLVDGDLPSQPVWRVLASAAVVERFDAAPAAPPAPFALVEAIGRRDAAAALAAMQQQLAQGKQEVEVVGLLVWQLQRWLTLRRGLDAGWSGERLASAAGVKPWQLARALEEAGRWPAEPLTQLLQRCWDVDVGIKTGKLVPRVALEALVVQMCWPRTSGREAAPSACPTSGAA